MTTTIQLRRDTETNWNNVGTWVPADGEICLVDVSNGASTKKYSYYKIGDGATQFSALEKNIPTAEVVSGYYLNDKFYSDSTYTSEKELEAIINKIYIDKNTNVIYHYTGVAYTSVNDNLPNASDVVKGIMYLYDTNGTSTSGTMTQRSISQGITDVKFAVDSDDSECLILNKPW